MAAEAREMAWFVRYQMYKHNYKFPSNDMNAMNVFFIFMSFLYWEWISMNIPYPIVGYVLQLLIHAVMLMAV